MGIYCLNKAITNVYAYDHKFLQPQCTWAETKVASFYRIINWKRNSVYSLRFP